MELFDKIGFRWDRDVIPDDVPTHDLKRVLYLFRKTHAEFVWDASTLEGNPFTYAEVQTLLEGITVGGRKLSDQEQVVRLSRSLKELERLVAQKDFKLDKKTFCHLHEIVANHEAWEWGNFRGEGKETQMWPKVFLGEKGEHVPPETMPGAINLKSIFRLGTDALNEQIKKPIEKGMAFFLFGALNQFFFDGNKRTSRLMMNGILMSAGINAISVPAGRATEFNEKMIDFYKDKDATEMMVFLLDCHPEANLFASADPKGASPA